MVIIAKAITNSSFPYIILGSKFLSITPVLKCIIIAIVIDVRQDI